MHHCFPTFTQTTSKNFRVRFTHVTCANIYFWTKFALLPNDQICECFLTFAFGFLIVFVLMRDERSKRHLFEVTMSTQLTKQFSNFHSATDTASVHFKGKLTPLTNFDHELRHFEGNKKMKKGSSKVCIMNTSHGVDKDPP